MDASGEKREIGRTGITSIHKEQGKPPYSSDMLGVELIRSLKAAAGRSTPLSSARKWTPRRVVVNSTSPCHSLTKIAASSSSKSVFLHDWWLINAEDGKGLAIGGFTYMNERKTLFHSAVIIKRHDAVTLETKDAMTILISGNINRQYSLGNGFSTEILNRFMIGFPCDWEEYYASQTTKPTDSCPGSNNLVTSLDQTPPVRNIAETELVMKKMYEDLQKQVGERASVGSKNHGTTKATCSNVGVDDEGKLPEVEQLKTSIATAVEDHRGEQPTPQKASPILPPSLPLEEGPSQSGASREKMPARRSNTPRKLKLRRSTRITRKLHLRRSTRLRNPPIVPQKEGGWSSQSMTMRKKGGGK